jgi:hypothetical protein
MIAIELLLGVNDRLTSAIQTYDTQTEKPSTSPKEKEDTKQFEIGQDDDGELEDINIDDEEQDAHLKQLRSEIEAEESATFLKAKQNEK